MSQSLDADLTDSRGKSPPGELNVDAFCIGAAKSGSTWLAHVVREHPEIQVSNPKEPNFLTAYGSPYRSSPPDNFLSSWDWYMDCFPEPAPVNIDFSIHTIVDPEAPARIKAAFPDSRFLLILRDPVHRLYSHYRMEERKKIRGDPIGENVEPTFEEAIHNDELVRRSRYAELLEPWIKQFPRERFHITILENASQAPLESVQRTFRFLGVDDTFEPPRLDKQVHPGAVTRGFRQTLARGAQWGRQNGLRWLIDPVGKRFPYRVVKKLDKKPVRYPPLEPRLEHDLRHHFLPEVEKMERMFDIDLDVWKPDHQNA